MTRKSMVLINKEGQLFVARSLELGVTSQGKNVEEAKKNLKEAIELYLEDAPGARNNLSKESPLVTSLEIGR